MQHKMLVHELQPWRGSPSFLKFHRSYRFLKPCSVIEEVFSPMNVVGYIPFRDFVLLDEFVVQNGNGMLSISSTPALGENGNCVLSHIDLTHIALARIRQKQKGPDLLNRGLGELLYFER